MHKDLLGQSRQRLTNNKTALSQRRVFSVVVPDVEEEINNTILKSDLCASCIRTLAPSGDKPSLWPYHDFKVAPVDRQLLGTLRA